jgi:aminomethyltransferase
VGAAALAARRAHPRRQLGGLRIDSTTTVAWGDCVHAGRARVGVVTSATHSPLLAQQIALAPVDVTHAGTGTPLAVGTLDR